MMADDPQTKAEVEAQFAAYERALVSNDVTALDRFFLASDTPRSGTAQPKICTATKRSRPSAAPARPQASPGGWRRLGS
jgi:Protein of unknown function (DUF3225)